MNTYNISPDSQAAVVSMVCPAIESHSTEELAQNSLAELKELLSTLGIECCLSFIQKRNSLVSGTILGKGKLEEIALAAKEAKVNLLVFDIELTASQMRNIKKVTKLDAIDRNTVILEIFAKHAHTKEAKIQIETARLQYLLPRLTSLWTHFHRQRGGVGVLGGEGEQQIELDRRIVRSRIQANRRLLKDMVIARQERQKKRHKQTVTAALVGYTNVGKSSLMNRLCQVNIKEENKLFATLDSTYRTLNPDTKPPLILIDTVGFISHLPTSLIEGFKTTLESAQEADLLLIVCDISSPTYKKQLQTTLDVLEELGLKDKQKFFIFNKKDLSSDQLRNKILTKNYPHSFLVSSFSKEDMQNLRTEVIEYFLNLQPTFDLFIPYSDGAAHSQVKSQSNVLKEKGHETGIFYRIKTPDFIFNKLKIRAYQLQPNHPYYQKELSEWS